MEHNSTISMVHGVLMISLSYVLLFSSHAVLKVYVIIMTK